MLSSKIPDLPVIGQIVKAVFIAQAEQPSSIIVNIRKEGVIPGSEDVRESSCIHSLCDLLIWIDYNGQSFDMRKDFDTIQLHLNAFV
jgi:hypothetical protein